MKGFIAKVFNWIMSFNTLPTASEQINAVLAGFTGMVEKLDAAIDQATDEIGASLDRVEEAWDAYRELEDREYDMRMAVHDAQDKAQIARNNIAALTGGAA